MTDITKKKFCIACQKPLNSANEFLVCANQKCPRYGLAQVIFAKARKVEDEDNRNKAVQQEDVQGGKKASAEGKGPQEKKG